MKFKFKFMFMFPFNKIWSLLLLLVVGFHLFATLASIKVKQPFTEPEIRNSIPPAYGYTRRFSVPTMTSEQANALPFLRPPQIKQTREYHIPIPVASSMNNELQQMKDAYTSAQFPSSANSPIVLPLVQPSSPPANVISSTPSIPLIPPLSTQTFSASPVRVKQVPHPLPPMYRYNLRPQVQRIYNPVPVMTHYNMPVLHHIPVNQLIRKYIPVYYPIPVEHKINIPVKIPIQIPQRILIPQAVPYGVKVPIPFPVKVDVPQIKEIPYNKPIYVKVPVYEHIPIYHHFAIKAGHAPKKEKDGDIEDNEDQSESKRKVNEDDEELNKQYNQFLKEDRKNHSK